MIPKKGALKIEKPPITAHRSNFEDTFKLVHVQLDITLNTHKASVADCAK